MFGLVIEWHASKLVHLISGGDTVVESSYTHALGVITDGCTGGGMTVCGKRFHGVMGTPDGDPRATPGVCVDCVAVFEAQRRHILPAGWTRDDLMSYWRGFDHGAQYAAFMADHPVSEFGYVPMSMPDYIGARDNLRARFDQGAEDGVRAFGAGESFPQW